MNRHNKVVQEIRKFLISSRKTRSYTLMNAQKFDNQPHEHLVPNWLLPCKCNTLTKCKWNTRLWLDILCIQNLPYNSPPPTHPDPNLTIQFIEFTYSIDTYSNEKFIGKTNYYEDLMIDVANHEWKVNPILIPTNKPQQISNSYIKSPKAPSNPC